MIGLLSDILSCHLLNSDWLPSNGAYLSILFGKSYTQATSFIPVGVTSQQWKKVNKIYIFSLSSFTWVALFAPNIHNVTLNKFQALEMSVNKLGRDANGPKFPVSNIICYYHVAWNQARPVMSDASSRKSNKLVKTNVDISIKINHGNRHFV